MTNVADVDPRELAELLQNDRSIRDAEVIHGPEPTTISVLIVPQGFRAGHVLRQHVMALAGDTDERLQVVLLREIPRDRSGSVDHDEALVAISHSSGVYRFKPPATEAEQSLSELVLEVLPGRQVSMTDSLAVLGGDSLAAVELATLISERLGIEIDPHQVFAAESLRHLTAQLSGPATREAQRDA